MYSGIVLSYYGAQQPKLVEQVFENRMPSIFYGCPEIFGCLIPRPVQYSTSTTEDGFHGKKLLSLA